MYFVIVLILFLILWTVAIAGLSFAPWVPSKKHDFERIFKLANLKPGEIFYDLGCGTGKVVIYAHKKFKAKSIGLEIALPFYCICKCKQIFNPGVNFKYKNLYKEDLSRADVIYFFGTPKTINEKLKAKLEREVKKGARIISYVFAINNWSPAVVSKPDDSAVPIYLYLR
ncbi:class I SAM-dependent methyltransferase [Candidatus Falkowbacteria bacterium]|nr:class I SAM-dependent methyltransferase [Candidatus Falkowbacteria bacterium]